MKSINLSANVTVTLFDSKYYYTQRNQYTHSFTTSELNFDKDGQARVQTSSQCYHMVSKATIDVSFHVLNIK